MLLSARPDGVSLESMISRMDASGIERSFLIAAEVGTLHHPACYHVPCKLVVDAVQKYPDRFCGLAGVDPTEGMDSVHELHKLVTEYGFIGAHRQGRDVRPAPARPGAGDRRGQPLCHRRGRLHLGQAE
jgi:predicted TIM-barrel fold metal-dependent hydrolase